MQPQAAGRPMIGLSLCQCNKQHKEKSAFKSNLNRRGRVFPASLSFNSGDPGAGGDGLKGMSIRFRLMLLMICLTTLPVITVTWIATNNTRVSVEKEIIDANRSRMMWANQYLDELIRQIDTLFVSLHINQQLIERLAQAEPLDAGTEFQTQAVIGSTIKTAYYSYSRKIDNLTLYTHANKRAFTINHANTGMTHALDIASGPWSRMLLGPVNMYFKPAGDNINAYHSMNEFMGRELIGGIAVRINKSVWEQVEHILQSEPESAVFLMNDEGELLPGSSSPDESAEIQAQLAAIDPRHVGLAVNKTSSYFFFSKRVNSGQLHLVKAIPIETINKGANTTMTAGIWTGALFALASVVLSIFVSLRISRPIISLARTMRKQHLSDFEMKSVRSKDEIGLLEVGYNSMMHRLKSLIEVEYQRELDLKNAQLIALQAQINPHFLNNTLHMIGGMALAKGAPEIYRITQVIGDLLRYSISTEGELVSLGDELKHMENYLFIQEQRFIGRCRFVVENDEAAFNTTLPKLTLQPIVENAFEHGLQRKEGRWLLHIRTRRIGNRIAIMVGDAGIGINQERLRQLRSDIRAGSNRFTTHPHAAAGKRRGIGLLNVHARLTLQFGKKYGVRLFSREGTGALAVILLPAEQGTAMPKAEAEERGSQSKEGRNV
ncbi:sensor histidine kinase [Paenibacillaceae bacterium]|nr:sensor histidine kinase [Paenibacillaceae bacterium]